jgi:hypothetical protein
MALFSSLSPARSADVNVIQAARISRRRSGPTSRANIFDGTSTVIFTDADATNYPARFYRGVTP